MTKKEMEEKIKQLQDSLEKITQEKVTLLIERERLSSDYRVLSEYTRHVEDSWRKVLSDYEMIKLRKSYEIENQTNFDDKEKAMSNGKTS